MGQSPLGKLRDHRHWKACALLLLCLYMFAAAAIFLRCLAWCKWVPVTQCVYSLETPHPTGRFYL